MTEHPAVDPLLEWYAGSARALPWRRPGAGAWAVLVSEVMLQQTQVARVLPVYTQWLARWPTPADLAGAAPGEAIRAWGRLGYPRRALRLREAAVRCVARHQGRVPDDADELRALPGVGEYTAAAVRAFAFGRRALVLDTNVRRVQARLLDGQQHPPPGATTAAERRRADDFLPTDDARAARLSAAAMELGATICTARRPGCSCCPASRWCRWLAAGRPEWAGPPRRGQSYAGTDRQCRGRLLAVLREAPEPVGGPILDAVWDDAGQRERALDGLVADGLIEPVGGPEGLRFRLPESPAPAKP